MRRTHLIALAAGIAFSTVLSAFQAPGGAPAPAGQAPAGAPQAGRGGRGGGGPVKSPEVAADGKVTFRLRAPNAKEVAVQVSGKRIVLTKDEQGLWTGTSDALKP